MGKQSAFIRDQRGATAVEFALVSSALFLAILFTLIVAVILYFNQSLDYATSKASRQIMIGAVQKASMSQSDFRTKVVCSYLPAGFNCDNVIVNVQTTAEAAQPAGYYTYVKADMSGLIIPALSNTSAQYVTGTQGAYVYVQVLYPITFLPAAFAQILGGSATYNGVQTYLAVSTAAFRNEQY